MSRTSQKRRALPRGTGTRVLRTTPRAARRGAVRTHGPRLGARRAIAGSRRQGPVGGPEYGQDDDVLARGYDRRRCPRGLPLPRTSSPSRATPPNESGRIWSLCPSVALAAPRPPREAHGREEADEEDSGTDR